jgi:ABC-type sugar transport system ATPase subunit
MIHQELNLFPNMTVEENIFIGRENHYKIAGIVNKNKNLKETLKIFKEIQLDIDPKTKIRNLSMAQNQMIEIVKAISSDSKVIIMDEPTSAITEKEIKILFDLIRDLSAKGKSVIYISHKLDEVFEISDTITILRDGCHIDTRPAELLTKKDVIMMMVGRELKDVFVKEVSKKEKVMLEVEGITNKRFRNVSFKVHEGEILGIAGLMGAGRTDIAEAIFGLQKIDSGRVLIEGNAVRIKKPTQAIKRGLCFVTEDRKLHGLNLKGSVLHNISIVNLLNYTWFRQIINKRKETHACDGQIDSLAIKVYKKEVIVNTLSGGNQQKVVLAKWLLKEPKLIILDEPTRGIDVGTKAEIYKIMTHMAAEGKAIIMISSEMPELLGMCDRLVIVHNGEIKGELNREDFEQGKIMAYAIGDNMGVLQ